METLADAAVSGPIPMYVSVPAEEYSALLSADAQARADAVFEAMEEETYPVGVVDKLSSVLAGAELGAVENSYAVGELAAIYAAAAGRGDAIAVLMN